MIGHEDINELKKVFDDRYVMQSKCDSIQRRLLDKFANDDKRIGMLVQIQKVNNWLTATIAAGIITLLIKVFFGG